MLKQHLKNALSGIKEFHDVEMQEELQFCTNGTKLDHRKHTEAVQSVATHLDKQTTRRQMQPRRQARQVHLLDQEDKCLAHDNMELLSEFDDLCQVDNISSHEHSETFDINTAVMETNNATRHPLQGSQLPGNCWHNLSAHGQKVWDTLHKQDKQQIIKALSS